MSFRHRRRSGCNRAPLYPVLQRLFGIKTRKLEWVGIAIGLAESSCSIAVEI